MRRLVFTAVAAAMLSAGCSRSTPDTAELIRDSVRATIEALPTPTILPSPSPIPIPSSVSLLGVFCEYAFCIGHPRDLAFYDVVAKQNPTSPVSSTYDEGMLATNDVDLFIQVIWQAGPDTGGPAQLLDLIVDQRVDTRSAQSEAITVADTLAAVVQLTKTASELLPYGEAAAWACGDRSFAWKAYAIRPELPRQLLVDALTSFRCYE